MVDIVIGATVHSWQVCDSAGQWIDVPYIPGTILLLAGEFLHFHSNKKFKPGVSHCLESIAREIKHTTRTL